MGHAQGRRGATRGGLGGAFSEQGVDQGRRYRPDYIPILSGGAVRLPVSAGQEQRPLQGRQVRLGRRTGPGGGHARLGQHAGHPLPLIGEERVRRLPYLNGQALRIHGEHAAEADAAAACGPVPVPVRLIRDVLAAQGMAGDDRIADALEPLRSRMLVTAGHGLWHMHGVIRQAVRHHCDAKTVDWFASACAEYLVRVLAAGPTGHDDDEWQLLVRHARHLVDRPVVTTVNALLPLIARELRESGHHASAARYLDRLLDAGVVDPRVAVDAAADHYDVGEYEQTVTIASAALTAGTVPEDILLAYLLASALDALGRFADAEPHWLRAVDPAAFEVLSAVERTQVRLRWIRGRRLRGTFKPNRAELEDILAAAAGLPEWISHLALIELAHIQLATDEQGKARENARRVVDHYVQRGQQHRPIAVDAEYVLATAELRLQFTELKADPDRWAGAEAALRSIAAQREEELGPRNVEVLATRVNIDFSLVSQGKAKEALASSNALLQILNDRLDERHPMLLREYYVHGLAHEQLAHFDEAVEALGHAHSGQLLALGITHPETLQTQFEFAMALKLRGYDGDRRRANPLLDEVVKRASSVTGWLNDLPWQAFIAAKGVRFASTRLLRWAHKRNHGHKW